MPIGHRHVSLFSSKIVFPDVGSSSAASGSGGSSTSCTSKSCALIDDATLLSSPAWSAHFALRLR